MKGLKVSIVLLSVTAAAQAQESPQSTTEGEPVQSVVITGTRVLREGFSAPTPTTVIGQEDIELRAPMNAVNVINQIPSFRPSQTSISRPAFQGSGPVSADLRGLGNRRTLTLVDGERFVPAAANGVVDLNLVPTNMIERVEVVTGGASAAWGSDAVSGVVNFFTKKKFSGFDANLSFGETEYNDDRNVQASFTLGHQFGSDERARLVFGFEYYHQGLVDDIYARPWGRKEIATVTYPANPPRPAGQPSRLVVPNVRTTNQSTFGGVIIGANADTNPANGVDVLRGIQFGPGGTRQDYPYGQTFGTSAIGGGNYSETGGRSLSLSPELNRYVSLTNFEYELSPRVTGFAQLNVGRSEVYFQTASRRDFNTVSTSANPTVTPTDYILIRRDNAYLPDWLRTIMTTNNINSFYMGRVGYDIGMADGNASNDVRRGVLGLRGTLGDTWKWDVSFESGRNEYYQPWSNETIESRYQKAYDAVLSPSGQIVCRVNQVTVTEPGCVPLNLFGYNAATNMDEVRGYISGTLVQDTLYRQSYAEANLTGEPFSTWAGPVSTAVGVSWRKDSVRQTSDPISQVRDFDNQNPQPFAGSYNAKEIYAETVVPLLKDVPLAQSLDLNGAARRTDYSTSGEVTTWKVGATWQVIDDLKFRTTVSRDIRAPNLLELYGIAQAVTNVINPYTLLSTGTIAQITGGNPALDPEKARSYTAGVVLQPRFLPRFRFSADFYHVKIDGAIASYTSQRTADNCRTEVDTTGAPGFFCGQLNTNGQFNSNLVIYGLTTVPFNLVKQTAEGIDFEAQYNFPLAGGNLNLRAFATRNNDLTLLDVASSTQYAGTVAYVFNGLGGTPKWLATLNTDYSYRDATVSLQTRYIGAAKIDPALIGPDDPRYSPSLPNSVNVNRVGARFYFNLSGTYNLLENEGRRAQLYLSVENLLNKDPPWEIGSGAGTNGQFYDTLGRLYKLGARVSF
jgi:outer membrane receptor protein involved in Fe transport